MMASLISVVARDWAPTEDSAEGGSDGCGRKSREGDEGDENKDERRSCTRGMNVAVDDDDDGGDVR